MTVDELKEEKLFTEAKIFAAIVDFEKKTLIKVQSIGVITVQTRCETLLSGIETTIKV